MPRFVTVLALLGALGLSACADFPDFDGTITEQARRAPFPDLMPIEEILAGTGAGDRTTAEAAARSMVWRAERLRARQAAIERAVIIDNRTRRRMAAAVARHAG